MLTAHVLTKLIDLAETAIGHREHAGMGTSRDALIVASARRELDKATTIVGNATPGKIARISAEPTLPAMGLVEDKPDQWHEVNVREAANDAYHVAKKWKQAGYHARTQLVRGRGYIVLARSKAGDE